MDVFDKFILQPEIEVITQQLVISDPRFSYNTVGQEVYLWNSLLLTVYFHCINQVPIKHPGAYLPLNAGTMEENIGNKGVTIKAF